MSEKPKRRRGRVKVRVDKEVEEIKRKKRRDKITAYFLLACISLMISYVVVRILP